MIRNIWVKAALAAVLMAGFTMPAQASPLQFNTNFSNNPTEQNGFQNISNFQVQDGAFYAPNASTNASALAGNPFPAYYQGQMTTFGLTAGGTVSVQNITITAQLTEQLIGLTTTASGITASFQVLSGSFALYYNPNGAGTGAGQINALAGTGYFNGTPIMTGDNATLSGPSTFTVNTTIAPAQFDQSGLAGASYWAGVTPNSITGTGSTQINFDVTSADSTYFNIPAGTMISINLFNPQLGDPFSSEDPSQTFNNDGNPSDTVTVDNNLGTVNGGTTAQGGGQFFEAESQGKGSFAVVPEPASMVLCFTAVGSLFGCSLLKRRKA